MLLEANKLILLVEDDAIIALSEANMLKKHGYSVSIAATGEEAVQKIREESGWAMVLMEIELGQGIDGPEAARQILSEYNLPIVFLSSHIDTQSLIKTENIAGYGFILKGSGEAVTIAAIKMAFRLFEAQKRELEHQQALEKSEANYCALYNLLRLMCDNVPDMIWAKDLEKNFLFANRAICRDLLNAKDTEEPLGKNDLFFALRERDSHPDDPEWHTFGDICRDTDEITMQAGKAQQFDEFGNIKGKFTFLDVHKAPLIDDFGKMIGVVGSARDVTIEKAISEELKDRNSFLDTLIEAIPLPVFAKDAGGIYTGVNQTFEKLVGKKREDLIGQDVFTLSPHNLAEVYRQKDLELFNSPGIQVYESKVANCDGEMRDVIFYKSTFTDSQGNVKGIIGIINDITDSMKANENIRDLLAEKELLLQEVQHRIKNNLAMAIGILEIQMDRNMEPEALAILRDTVCRLQSVSTLYNKLYRHPNSAAMPLEAYLRDLLTGINNVFSEGNSIEVEIAACEVELNARTLTAVGIWINELVTNAMKHAFTHQEEGKITIIASQSGNTIVLSVGDNGQGLPDDFDFSKSDGFGMQLVAIMAQQLKGKMELSVEKGSLFTLTFPF